MKRLATASATAILAVIAIAPSATAAPQANPVATINVASTRLDKQTPPPSVNITGVAKTTPVTVNWGDGMTRSQRTKCAPATAIKKPKTCTLHLIHYYSTAGTYTVTITTGARTLATKTVTLSPNVHPWTPPAGWVQPTGWAVLNGGATYLPCATVNWYWDRTGEPADRNLIHDEVQPALDILAKETGLKFTETTDPAQAVLTFKWSADVDTRYPGASAYGGGNSRLQAGTVTISPTNWWTSNAWMGLGQVHQADGTYANGNGWLLVHETAHVLGLAHVSDPNQVMNPVNETAALGAGDIDGLHTMYLNNPCPVA